MSTKTDRRPSAALIVSALALAVALSGTAYAAVSLPKNSVGASQIKKNAVRSAEVKNGSLKAQDFKSGQLDPSMIIKRPNQVLVTITAVINDPSNTVVTSMAMPAGTHYVRATVFADNTSGGLIAEPRCFLRSSGTEVAGGITGFYQPIQPNAGTNADRAQFSLDAAFSLATSGTVQVECNKQAANQSVDVGATLSATRIGSAAVAP